MGVLVTICIVEEIKGKDSGRSLEAASEAGAAEEHCRHGSQADAPLPSFYSPDPPTRRWHCLWRAGSISIHQKSREMTWLLPRLD